MPQFFLRNPNTNCSSIKLRNSPPAVLLREDHREDGRTIKRTLANLSALPPEAVAALRAALKGERLVGAADYFVVEQSLPCGHVRAVKGTMERLKMTELIASKPCRERDLVLAMDRDHTRTELLEATEAWLGKVAAQVAQRTRFRPAARSIRSSGIVNLPNCLAGCGKRLLRSS